MRTEYLERLKASKYGETPPWLCITSAELAKAIGVHMQTLANWRLRDKDPLPLPQTFFKGRPHRYLLAFLKSWAEEEAGTHRPIWKIHAEWLRDHMDFKEWEDKDAVVNRVRMLQRLSKDYRPEALTRAGREVLIDGVA